MAWPGGVTPMTWLAGMMVTDSIMNQQIRDKLLSLRNEHFPVERFRGLRLRTHPDSDRAPSVVQFSADAIVMDDGTRLTGWSNVEVNMATAGAGGLDAGAEAASTFYEVWAIAKDDGTKSAVFHRAKDFFLDESQTNNNQAGNVRDAAARTKRGQEFSVDTAGPLPFVEILGQTVGAPTGKVWFEIYADNAGLPGSLLATSRKLDISRLPIVAQWIRFVFDSPATLSADPTKYHLVCAGDFAISGTNYFDWRASNTDAYARGQIEDFDGATWTNSGAAADFCFRIYIERNNTAVTLPTGYTKKAKIHPGIFNNGSSNFLQTMTVDRTTVQEEVASGSFSMLYPAVFDLRSAVPPVPLILHAGIAHDTVGNPVVLQVDPYAIGFQQRVFAYSALAAIKYIAVAPLSIEPYQGIYAYVGTSGNGAFVIWGYTW